MNRDRETVSGEAGGGGGSRAAARVREEPVRPAAAQWASQLADVGEAAAPHTAELPRTHSDGRRVLPPHLLPRGSTRRGHTTWPRSRRPRT